MVCRLNLSPGMSCSVLCRRREEARNEKRNLTSAELICKFIADNPYAHEKNEEKKLRPCHSERKKEREEGPGVKCNGTSEERAARFSCECMHHNGRVLYDNDDR